VGARHGVRLVPLEFAAVFLQRVDQGHDLAEYILELAVARQLLEPGAELGVVANLHKYEVYIRMRYLGNGFSCFGGPMAEKGPAAVSERKRRAAMKRFKKFKGAAPGATEELLAQRRLGAMYELLNGDDKAAAVSAR